MHIDKITATEFEEWEKLYKLYGEFYKISIDVHHAKLVWEWIHDPKQAFFAYGAYINEQLIGFTHHRIFLHSLKGGTSLFLDDLFVLREHRTKGIGKALLNHLFEESKKDGHKVVRWITDPSNTTAKKLYNTCAKKTRWETYEY